MRVFSLFVTMSFVFAAIAGCLSAPAAGQEWRITEADFLLSREQQNALLVGFERDNPFEAQDRNGDSYLSLAEWNDAQWGYMLLYDLDHSGSLSRPEYITATRPYPRPSCDLCMRSLQSVAGEFAEDDRNHDGVVTREEYEAQLRRYFRANDRCRDGRLSRYETGEFRPRSVSICAR